MHDVGPQLVEQPGVVRDREHAQVVVGGHGLDAAGDVAQRVDVEPAVDLVEHRELRPEHRELQRLGPLLLAAGELDVDPTLEELRRDPEPGGLRADALVAGPRRVAALAAERGVEEVVEPHARQLDRVLQREEEPVRRALVRRQPEQLVAVDGDRTAR